MGSFPVLAKEPVELTITNTGDKVLELTGTGKITVGIPCDRCLETVAVEIPLEFKKKLDMKLLMKNVSMIWMKAAISQV